ncbi:formate dehydrogenase subunit gamma [Pseudosulfitobacter sp. DSM 107133]|uniref:formate dehydrogenase subunit gamma n=1 Tax=Pseudosulfitobacter sp. DSM 107133 TaxID=2883100 RepID=UPI000DF1DEF1|nr:formate dehydrogenase subunit gamma [Pseudosulfitobacter sp. DSM 107133]UOA29299.1 Formate dehydrogenase, nitrate-inducible, cytochrome b556(Fdn) subunit [Pseudosulfitobacter sp. DSM 107133]
MLRHLMAFIILAMLAVPGVATAQDVRPPENAVTNDVPRAATGGAQTLDDVLRRQQGQTIDDSFRRDNIGGDAGSAPGLGPLGGISDAEQWRALRYNEADVTVTTMDERGKVLVQDGGMWWLNIRRGPLPTYGGWLLLGTLAVLAIFFLLRGRVRVEGGLAGRTVTRFKAIERFAHWMLAGSFILLALTGLLTLFGRKVLVPYLGHEFNSVLLIGSKFIHNNVSWAFMIALVMVFAMWVWHNLPDRTDLTWFRYGGGIIGKKHPPAKKFNAGQKLIFWSVIVLGASVSASGLSLLFPFDLPLFGHTFAVLNDSGLSQAAGLGSLPVDLAPQEEMQYAQLWHAIIGFVMMAIILGHIYIGTLGMEGAYDAMGSGEVDVNWAEQHHSIWLEKVKETERRNPAE